MSAVTVLPCGCEATTDAGGGPGSAISYCPEHNRPVGVFTCGECGFASWRFDRLERHVYAVHLGAQVA
jgi:hypothetical protein